MLTGRNIVEFKYGLKYGLRNSCSDSAQNARISDANQAACQCLSAMSQFGAARARKIAVHDGMGLPPKSTCVRIARLADSVISGARMTPSERQRGEKQKPPTNTWRGSVTHGRNAIRPDAIAKPRSTALRDPVYS